ncbi:hypothetical protein DFH05DRAFT_1520182 [Lentinula detonsa]|uniref:MFS general substrate transporter n=1 Tax=Lentinula detonsa TaxID=2804962 RepID=A0A9W8U142_9AGAR|nr:hypothetical protein DFH05DRAFT_1520182 [Lentinula detonsa]
MQRESPSAKYLAINIFLWGVLLIFRAQASSRTFTDLAVLRILSGAFEAIADPAYVLSSPLYIRPFMLITSIFYRHSEQPSRISMWYAATNGVGVAGGGLLGYAIGHIKGLVGELEAPYRRALSAPFGVVSSFCSSSPDSPPSARTLTYPVRKDS